jgi:hypothetical protein
MFDLELFGWFGLAGFRRRGWCYGLSLCLYGATFGLLGQICAGYGC